MEDTAKPLTTGQSVVTLDFNNLTYSVKNPLTANVFLDFVRCKKNVNSSEGEGGRLIRILDKVSGSFKPGQLTAIIGPSGSGKTTLMNVLAGYKTNNIVDGTISVNGHLRRLSKFKKMSSYIMQDELLLENLTIREAMNFAALLKLPRKVSSKEQRQLVISDILKTIGLLDDCADVRTRDLSGGQRKRLSIALELVNNPPVMFLDEPTSGLDTSTCFSCVRLLKSLTSSDNRGRTIVVTIHQASARILEQFDALYILSARGQNIYRGSPQFLVSFFDQNGLKCPANHNPADFAIEVANGDFGQESIDRLVKAVDDADEQAKPKIVDESDHKSKTLSKPYGGTSDDDSETDEESKVGHFFHQIWPLYCRSLLCISRDSMLTYVRFGASILVGILLGILNSNVGDNASKCFHNAGSLQFGIVFLVLCALMPTVVTFPLERGVFLREHGNSWYSVKSYFFARLLADLPFQLLPPIIFTCITYYMMGQPVETFRFLTVILISVLVSLVAQSIGSVIGAIFSVQSAVYIAPVTVIPMIVFSGFFVTISTVPGYLRWVSWFAYTRWAFQSTLTAIYGYDRQPLQCAEEYCHFKYPQAPSADHAGPC